MISHQHQQKNFRELCNKLYLIFFLKEIKRKNIIKS